MKRLFAHQTDALAFLADKPAAAVFAGLGTGKTRIILEDARRLGAALVVVCPKTALTVWESQIETWQFEGPVYLINYERVWRSPNKDGIHRDLGAWIANQRHRRPVMVVADESHKIKDRTTKQSKAARKLARLADYRRIVSGTPVLNGHQDLWAQYNFLIGDFPDMELWRSWKKFAEDHLDFHPFFPSKVESVRNLPVIQRQLAPFTFHIRADAVLDLPPATNLYRECELGARGREVYKSVEAALYAELDEHSITIPVALVKILRLAEITGGFVHAIGDDTGAVEVVQVDRAKLDLLRDVVEEIGDEKVVVFTRFTAERIAVEALLKKMGVETRSLHGGQTVEERSEAQTVFNGAAQALVAMLQVGSSSIDLSVARYICFFSVGFSFGDVEQAKGRIRRHGQTRPQFYIWLIAKGTIDEHILHALSHKQGVSEAVQKWWEAIRV